MSMCRAVDGLKRKKEKPTPSGVMTGASVTRNSPRLLSQEDNKKPTGACPYCSRVLAILTTS